MRYFFSDVTIRAASARLKGLFETLQPKQGYKIIVFDEGRVYSQIKSILVNNAFKRSPEEANRDGIIIEIIEIISGINKDSLLKMRDDYNIETCVDYIKKILFYNTLTLLTFAIFDEHGSVLDFFVNFLKQYITFPEEFVKKIKNPSDLNHASMYRAVVNALIFICLDPLLAILSEEKSKFYLDDTILIQRKTRDKAEKALGSQKKSLSGIALSVEDLRNKLLGSPDAPAIITVKEQVIFVGEYLALNQIFLDFFSSRILKDQLSSEDVVRIKSTIADSPRLSLWEKGRALIGDNAIKILLRENTKLQDSCKSLETLLNKTEIFEGTVRKGRHSIFFSSNVFSFGRKSSSGQFARLAQELEKDAGEEADKVSDHGSKAKDMKADI